MSRFVKFLKQVLTRTDAGNLQWQETFDDDTFRLPMKNGVVEVSRVHDEDVEEHYIIANLQAPGTTRLLDSETFRLGNDASPLAFFDDLYKAARRSALKVDDVLSELEKEIDPDDIPF